MPGCLIVSGDGNQSSSCHQECEEYEVCETYCDAWTCWDECWYETHCYEDCTYVEEEPIDSTQCYSDIDCYDGEICVAGYCEPPTTDERGLAGLCQTCETDADCAEGGALCLRLNFDTTSRTGEKVCGRTCEYNHECPTGFECSRISSEAGVPAQCIPIKGTNEKRTCNPSPELECVKATDCAIGESCVNNECQGPDDAECSSNRPCPSGEVCRNFSCVAPDEPECVDRSDCSSGQVCLDGKCESRNDSCVFNEECDGDAKCVDGQCNSTCSESSECGPNERCRQGLCEQIGCRRSADCAAGEVCVDAYCAASCQRDADCGTGYLCNPLGYCEKDPDVECRSTAECARDEICSQGSCQTACSCNQQCDTGEVCNLDSGLCEDPNAPDPAPECEDDCDCPSGMSCSTDGVCQ
jgi:hypothetical protein